MEVVRVEPRLLGRVLEQELGMVDDVLVDRGTGCDEDRDARALPPAGPTELLPRGSHRTRVAGEDRDIEPPDVHAELEGIRRDDAEDLAITKPAFDRPPFRRQVAAPIPSHAAAWTEAFAQRLAQPGQQQLDRDPRSAEDDRLSSGAEERQRPALGERHRRAARSARRLHDRRVDEQDVPLARWRTVAIHEACRSTGQHRRELGRVPDRRRATDDDRLAAVVRADPHQPPQYVRDVAAEDASVCV